MKKLSVILALTLCLVMVAFAFASCGPKKPASTTADGTAPSSTTAKTECNHVWGELEVDTPATCSAPGIKSRYCTICDAQDPDSITEIPQLDHTPGTEFVVDKEPTCRDKGYKSIHCLVCGLPIADTVEELDVDPKKHDVDAWVVDKEPTLLDPTGGARHGTCTICNEPVNEGIAWTQPMVYQTNWDAAARAASPYSIKNPDRKTVDIFGVKTNITKARGNGHYYPDESNENVGNDLLVEFSFLYNETMANATQDATLAVMNIENNNVFNINLKTGKITAKIRTENGGDSYVFESPSAVSHAVSIGEYGWHRFAMRMSQTAAIEDDAVKYTVIATAYLDGVKIFEIDKTNYALYKHNKGTPSGLLYTATIEDDKLVYQDLGTDGHFNDVYIMVEEIDKNESDPNAGYVVVADFKVTCGQDFVQQVEPNATPAAADDFVLDDKGTPDDTADDVTCPAKIYYQAQ